MTAIRIVAGDDLAAMVRGCEVESLVVVIAGTLDPLAMALAKAAMAPLAIERAPTMRLNAVIEAQTADPADVSVAVAFLETARSTTGQIVEIA